MQGFKVSILFIQYSKPSYSIRVLKHMVAEIFFDEQEVRQGRRAAQNSQPQLDAEEDVLDTALGDMTETDNMAVPTDLDQV